MATVTITIRDNGDHNAEVTANFDPPIREGDESSTAQILASTALVAITDTLAGGDEE